ncbi:MAG: hypothetical protein JSS68_03680 [Actinobacteria bacterium]|nr:hypothetical protein [Actinomycetota bacterium]
MPAVQLERGGGGAEELVEGALADAGEDAEEVERPAHLGVLEDGDQLGARDRREGRGVGDRPLPVLDRDRLGPGRDPRQGAGRTVLGLHLPQLARRLEAAGAEAPREVGQRLGSP